jgi:multicomponent Na+:H+ antiporter subunit B
MSGLILQTATRFMMPLLLLFSVFLLVRGHNLPGGGFIGGLVGASAFAVYALAFDVPTARQALRVDGRSLVAAGLHIALAAAVLPLFWNLPLLTHRYAWTKLWLFGFGELPLGTPLLFDLGVYLTVLGVSLTIILALAEE